MVMDTCPEGTVDIAGCFGDPQQMGTTRQAIAMAMIETMPSANPVKSKRQYKAIIPD